jgi:predicted RNase H-like HicB family nuclease
VERQYPYAPGCGTWGQSEEESLNALKEASQAYIDVLIEDGRPLPMEADDLVQVIDAPAIAVTL